MAKYFIQTNEETLNKRNRNISRIFKLISAMNSGPACVGFKYGTDLYGFAAYDIIGPKQTPDHHEWRFKTIRGNFNANYIEYWKRIDQKLFYLFQAYLTIFEEENKIDKPKEIICLHIDPNEPENKPHACYKQVPHIHIGKHCVSHSTISHAHFAFDSWRKNEIRVNEELLFQVFSNVLKMIRDEIFI